ncbi:hypothetical protein AMATHDRAFT_155736 [Amanita thiersii Skay4041]|uniref:NAD(P)-binding protein n=1 Tax=Amanita thiersii Skay4041 TaxID=703135 RepID=A0A2A9NAD6_9AGAR|nr:hypothetical protein AMATHDRAFT_155736 [Amanita thiersii Skay4041]
MTEQRPKVWLITGTSTGFGRCLVNSVLARGDLVIATARSLEKIQDFPKSDRLHLFQLDVNDSRDVVHARIEEAAGFWGRIDVLVNNAGYGLKALLEEGGSDAMMKQYQTNVYGVVNVTTATLPHMRSARSGTIVMMGSRTTWQPTHVHETAFYTSSKAAVHAFSEVLSVEVRQYNIQVLIVEPGGFLTKGMFSTPYYQDNRISDYDKLRSDSVERMKQFAGSFKGDPNKAMELVVDVVRREGKAKGRPWSLYLFLGNEAYDSVRAKCKEVLENLDSWEDVGKDLDFDNLMAARAV